MAKTNNNKNLEQMNKMNPSMPPHHNQQYQQQQMQSGQMQMGSMQMNSQMGMHQRMQPNQPVALMGCCVYFLFRAEIRNNNGLIKSRHKPKVR